MQTNTAAVDLFGTMPDHDYLNLLSEDGSKKVVDFLDLSKDDVAKATGVPKSSIRYDARMPEELEERLREIAVVCELVADYFKGDVHKTALWFKIKNPTLGNVSPRDMIRMGRYQKLIKFVQNSIAGHNP